MNSESQDALKRIHLGDVIVDSGVLLIADPAYIREEWQKGEPATEFYRRVGQVIDATRYGGLVSSKFNPYGLGLLATSRVTERTRFGVIYGRMAAVSRRSRLICPPTRHLAFYR